MSLKSFPFPIRLGVDLCKIDRVYGIINHPPKLRNFASKLLTPREASYFRIRYDLDANRKQSSRKLHADFLAGRWACKEAVIKASKPHKLTLRDVEIWPDKNKELYAIVVQDGPEYSHDDYDWRAQTPKEKKDEIANLSNVKDFSSDGFKVGSDLTWAILPDPKIHGRIARLSLSHDGEYAIAVAMDVNEE